MNEIFLGKLPEMVQGDKPLGEELIARLEQYAIDKELPTYELKLDEEGNTIAIKTE